MSAGSFLPLVAVIYKEMASIILRHCRGKELSLSEFWCSFLVVSFGRSCYVNYTPKNKTKNTKTIIHSLLMNTFGVLLYTFLLAFNQFYDMVLWPMFSIELLGGVTTLAHSDLDSFQMHILDMPEKFGEAGNATFAFEQIESTGWDSRFVIFMGLMATLLFALIRTEVCVSFERGATCALSTALQITGMNDAGEEFHEEEEYFDNIENFYPSMSINYNGSSIRAQTIYNKPTDVLIWDTKMFNPL